MITTFSAVRAVHIWSHARWTPVKSTEQQPPKTSLVQSLTCRVRIGPERTGTAFRFIFLVGPSVDCFNALPYVKKWLTRGHRAACDNQSRKSQPLKQECRYDHVRKIFD